jgi:hypothetical protein
MGDYVGLGVLLIFLAVSFLISKKDFKNWYELDFRDKYYAIRAPFIILVGMFLLLLKILKN